jgi:hypothetical protein
MVNWIKSLVKLFTIIMKQLIYNRVYHQLTKHWKQQNNYIFLPSL